MLLQSTYCSDLQSGSKGEQQILLKLILEENNLKTRYLGFPFYTIFFIYFLNEKVSNILLEITGP